MSLVTSSERSRGGGGGGIWSEHNTYSTYSMHSKVYA